MMQKKDARQNNGKNIKTSFVCRVNYVFSIFASHPLFFSFLLHSHEGSTRSSWSTCTVEDKTLTVLGCTQKHYTEHMYYRSMWNRTCPRMCLDSVVHEPQSRKHFVVRRIHNAGAVYYHQEHRTGLIRWYTMRRSYKQPLFQRPGSRSPNTPNF